jgi:hypothetical protein
MSSSFRRRSRLGLLLGFAVIASACGSSIPPASTPGASIASTSVQASSPAVLGTHSPNPSDLATFATIEKQVEAIRGLHARTPVTPVLLDSTELRAMLTKIDAEQTDHKALAAEGRLFIDLGLLPDGASLEQLGLDLDAGQVIGFYDTVSKGLYVLSDSGGVGAIEKATFAHEYTHALQDQNFGLDKLGIDTADQGDRDLARTSLAEGDATWLMTEWMIHNLSALDLQAIGNDPSSATQTRQLAAAPAILRQTLLFPYEQGLAFVEDAYDHGGWAAVDKLYSAPPASTSQILHSELYSAGVAPVALTVPAVPATMGSGWKLTMQDTLGELQLRVWLAGESPTDAATKAAASATADWGGDRVGLYEGPDGAWAVVLNTDWRSTAGSDAFYAAATTSLTRTPRPTRICGGAASRSVTVVIASVQTVIPELEPCR